ncbi:hypothetical protein GCM10027180_01870 [Microbulbifer echini]
MVYERDAYLWIKSTVILILFSVLLFVGEILVLRMMLERIRIVCMKGKNFICSSAKSEKVLKNNTMTYKENIG